MRRLPVLVLLLLLAWTGAASATPQISLLTFQPGEVYWQRYGHNALLVRDAAAGAPAVYNYGLFDFGQQHFLLNFARGRMLYRVAPESLSRTLAAYRSEGRWVYEQQLALSPDQARALADFLAWNAQPEEAEYRYHYFTANCSTRVRDALDAAVGGALRAGLEGRGATTSYRQEAARMMSPLPALMLGTDFLLGPRTDRPIDRWQQAFLPEHLMAAVRDVTVVDAQGARRPLVAREGYWYTGRLPATPALAPDPRLPMALAGLVLAALLVLGRRRRGVRMTLGAGPSLIAGLLGVILALGWGLTDHDVMAANQNLLLCMPLSLLLLPVWWRRSTALGGGALTVATVVALGPVLALLLQLTPLAQGNAHWIGFWLPIHLAGLLALAIRPRS